MKKLLIGLAVVAVAVALMYSAHVTGARRPAGDTPAKVQAAANAAPNVTVEIPVNGDFRGGAHGFSPAPGWALSANGGSAQVLPTDDPNKFGLELRSAEGRLQSALSVFHPIPAGATAITLHYKFSSGNCLAEVEFFDAEGSQRSPGLSSHYYGGHGEKAMVTKGKADHTRSPIPSNARYAMIRLSAGTGMVARFSDVKLKFSGPITSSSTPMSPTMTVATTNAAPLAGPVAALAPEAAVPIWCGSHETVGVRDRQFFDYQSLRPDEHFVTSLAFDQCLNFSLQESAAVRWRPCSYDPAVCELKLTHVNYDGDRKAMIDLRGSFLNEFAAATDVVLTDGAKTVTVHVIVPAPKR